MNPLVLFLPVYRASTTAFLAGLGVLALLDFARIEFGLLGGLSWIGMLAIWFFTLSLHINRRRHAERGVGLAFLPLVLAVIVKGIAAFFAMVASLYPAMLRFAEDNGVDTDDPVALNEALSEPGFQQEFSRSRQSLHQANERSALLSSVREDIREHRDSRQSDALLRERNAIGASARQADDILGQATATRDALNTQRGGFGGMAGKLSTIASLAPQINDLLSMISRRQKREKLILGGVVGVCTALMLIYGFG